MVEMFTTMDNGAEFSIERLYRGSVFNHNSFLMGDKIDVNARCKTPVTLFYLSTDKMMTVRSTCDKLNENLDAIEARLLHKDNPIALDYIISRDPSAVSSRNVQERRRLNRAPEEQAYRDKLTVKLKNAIMYYIVKTRILKRIPNFNEILDLAINKHKREQKAMRRK